LSINVLKQDCKIEESKDKTLPYTAYLVTYKVDGENKYDLATANKEADLFDYYYDLYKKDFVTFKQSGGIANPKTWNYKSPTPPKGKRK
tara:strand:+ start:1735 stop:2001 length:267 start_codon:yes stop_codon:yes gene_type:complete